MSVGAALRDGVLGVRKPAGLLYGGALRRGRSTRKWRRRNGAVRRAAYIGGAKAGRVNRWSLRRAGVTVRRAGRQEAPAGGWRPWRGAADWHSERQCVAVRNATSVGGTQHKGGNTIRRAVPQEAPEGGRRSWKRFRVAPGGVLRSRTERGRRLEGLGGVKPSWVAVEFAPRPSLGDCGFHALGSSGHSGVTSWWWSV